MSPTSEKVRQYVSLEPIRFNLVKRFEWVTVPLASGYSQQLSLQLISLRDGEDRAELSLRFLGVRNIRFTAAGLMQPLLDIRDVSDQQWDGVSYEVRDRENDTIYFLCRDFSVSVVEETA